jgi:autotransporter-associated beta strand protein
VGGLAGNAWDFTTANWQNILLAPATFIDGAVVRFTDSGNSASPVQLVGTLTPDVVSVESSLNYSFGGTGKISGPARISKAGTGVLTLNNSANDFTGTTTINKGTLALGSSGSLGNTPNLAIVAGGTLDVSAKAAYTVSSNTSLSASGAGTVVGATAATLKAAVGGTIGLGSSPITLTYDGAHPALYVSQGTVSLNGNAFTINSSSPLAIGTYTIIQQAIGNPVTSGSFSVTGSAIASGLVGSISVSGANVNLVVQQAQCLTNLSVSVSSNMVAIKYFALPGVQDYSWNSLVYVIQRATNLSAGAAWVPISTNVPTTNGWIQIADTFNDLGGQRPPHAYYRVQTTRDARSLILAAAPTTSIEQPFGFNLPAGPQFTASQRDAQRTAGSSVMPLVQQAFQAGALSVRIPPGDYRFNPETWGPNGVKHPFTIDASGATFWFDLPDDQAPTQHFCVGFVNCSNVIFYGATIDRGTRGHVEGAITTLDFVGNRIELLLSPGCTLPINFSNGLEQRLLPFKADGTFAAPLYALQAGGTKLKYSSITASATPGRCWVNLATPDLLQTIANTDWFNAYGEQGVLRVGDGLSCIYAVSSALDLVNSANVTIYGLRDYAPKAWGSESYGYGDHLWKDCYFGPRPGTSQWQGGEGFLFSGTRHGATLDNVTMLHTGDDMANFHGYWSEATTAAGNQLTFTFHAGNFYAYPPDAVVGDTILFYNRHSGTPLGSGKVTALTSATILTLDVPATPFANAIARWPEHECAGWVIQNCNWHDNYQRVLMQSGPGLIRNSTFTRNGHGMQFNFDFNFIEGGIPSNITITNNTFTDVAPMPGLAALNFHGETYGSYAGRLITNLTIIGNTITRPGEAAIEMVGVDGGVIAGNSIVDPIRATTIVQGSANPQQAIFLNNCANMSVLTNNVSDLGHFTSPSPATGSHILGTAVSQNITNLDGILQW